MSVIKKIPKQFVDGYLDLITLDQKLFESLIIQLELSPFSFDTHMLAKFACENDVNLNIDIIERILESVGSVFEIRDRFELLNDNLTKDIAETLPSHVNDTKITSEDLSKFRDRLKILLESSQLCISAKAQDLQYQSENVYLAARLITDIRPIFKDNTQEAPPASVILNTLIFHFQSGENNEHRDFQILMDSSDISSLKSILIRAENKNKMLEKVIQKSNMQYLNPNEEK